MTVISLKDILISARQESHRMRHYYLGVEHIFIALLEINNGLTSAILNDEGYTTEYLIDAIRRKAGKGSRHRLWAGIPNTPRADVVIEIAQEVAREDSRQAIQERDLLLAILDENDSIPVRVLKALGIDIGATRHRAKTHTLKTGGTQKFLDIELATAVEGSLSDEQLFILRRMFHGYSKVRVETRLTGGYSDASLLVVTPIKMGGIEAASVVVKIGQTDSILDEAQRYEKYVKDTLPPLTARLEDRPIAPEPADVAGLKYTFLTDDTGNPTDLRAVVQKWSGDKLGRWLHQHLYGEFGAKWWKQRRPYRFEAWREYDWMLPPILTLQLRHSEEKPSGATTLRFPIRRSKITALDLGELVVVENFIVHRVDRERGAVVLALAQGEDTARPYQIEVRGINFEQDTYFRGEIVERLIGSVWKTRDDQLMNALRRLEPDFEISGDYISINSIRMPNPVRFYSPMLDAMIEGSLSTIHGDLHLGNILIGPNDSALLIDFARTRDGHSIFDWANLEISLMSELIVPKVADNWDGARALMTYMAVVEQPEFMDHIPEDIGNALQVIINLRQIVAQNLAHEDRWQEYSLALAFSALRGMMWETMPQNSRRVMYLVAAVAMQHFNQRRGGESEHTPSPDSTDFFTTD